MATIDEECSLNILNTSNEGLKVCFRTVERHRPPIYVSTKHVSIIKVCQFIQIEIYIYTYIYIYIYKSRSFSGK